MTEIDHDLSFPLGVVCHDAGASNIIFSFLEKVLQFEPTLGPNIRIFACGPAEKLLMQYELGATELTSSIDAALKNSVMLLAGTGWQTEIELIAVKRAQEMPIRAVAVIDHWVNYLERFSINGITVTPTEVWVTDEYAQVIAARELPTTKIQLRQNFYLQNMVGKVKCIPQEPSSRTRILYLLEPMRASWKSKWDLGEFDALAFFFESINLVSDSSEIEVRLRPHPSDPPGKYDTWTKLSSIAKVHIENNLPLEESIAWADLVVGCQTMAMVVALEAGKLVISTNPPHAPPCRLPHKNIIKLTNLINLS